MVAIFNAKHKFSLKQNEVSPFKIFNSWKRNKNNTYRTGMSNWRPAGIFPTPYMIKNLKKLALIYVINKT